MWKLQRIDFCRSLHLNHIVALACLPLLCCEAFVLHHLFHLPFATPSTFRLYNDLDQEEVYFSPNAEMTRSSHERQDHDLPNKISNESDSTYNEYSFFDEAVIYVRSGSGGQGSSTFKKGAKGQNAQPDGGNGGRGGDVYLVADESLNTLAGLNNAWRPNSFGGSGAVASSDARAIRPLSFRADNGEDGGRQFTNGRFGKDIKILVPPGTLVQEEIDVKQICEDTGEEITLETRHVDIGTVELSDNNNILLVARGGEGGEGNGAQSKFGRGVRRPRAPSIGGEKKRLKLTLKIVADVALVGVPNAGKSTFLAAVTRAKPKIANYPFTTVVPNLGVWIPQDNGRNLNSIDVGSGSSGLVLCDVPGLIDGAADGAGLGHAFLRHVERCHVILHLVDATSIDPLGDFRMINGELSHYGDGKLAKKPQVVVVNKIDAWDEEKTEEFEKGMTVKHSRSTLESQLLSAMPHNRLLWMSAKHREGVDELMGRMHAFVQKVKAQENNSC